MIMPSFQENFAIDGCFASRIMLTMNGCADWVRNGILLNLLVAMTREHPVPYSHRSLALAVIAIPELGKR